MRPIHLNSWSTITPVIGGRLTYYGNPKNGASEYTRILGQIGFDAQMDIWGTWEYQSKTMGIDGLRHHITPIMSYRYIPNATQGSGAIPTIDEISIEDFTYPPILDLGEMRNTDRLFKTNTLRLGIKNTLETRDETYGSRELARLDIFQDFNFDKRVLAQNDFKRCHGGIEHKFIVSSAFLIYSARVNNSYENDNKDIPCCNEVECGCSGNFFANCAQSHILH